MMSKNKRLYSPYFMYMCKHEKREVEDLVNDFYKTKRNTYEAGVTFNLNKKRMGQDTFERFFKMK